MFTTTLELLYSLIPASADLTHSRCQGPSLNVLEIQKKNMKKIGIPTFTQQSHTVFKPLRAKKKPLPDLPAFYSIKLYCI